MAEQHTAQPWYRDPIKIVPLAVALVGLPLTLNQVYEQVIKKDPDPTNVQYVVDVSDGMRGKIGKKSKLSAVTEEVILAVGGRPHTAFSLRLAGGEQCSDAYQPPRVPFGRSNVDQFERTLASITAGGRSDFARAVRYAVDDLISVQDLEGTKRASLVFLIGGADQCTPRPQKVINDALNDLDEAKTHEVYFKFVGVKIPKATRKILTSATRRARATGFPATFEQARTAQDLESVISDPAPPPSP